MEYIIDTFDLDEIRDAVDHLPVAGVTSNPSIVKKTAPKNFFAHARMIRDIIGRDKSLHIQVTALDAEGMLKEADRICKEVDEDVYIKIPSSYEGIKAIKALKAQGRHVTATAIYTLDQAYVALAAGADYIAPYVNRIGNLGGDPNFLIEKLAWRIEHDHYDCKILAASFKGVEQVQQAFNHGTQAVTAPVEILKAIFNNPNINQAVSAFNADWYATYGEGKSLCDL